MRLENELKGERMVTPGIETGPRIVRIDRGSSQQWSEISETGMWTPFAIDAKGGEMKTKGEMQGEMQTKREHAHRGSMSCCHQWQRGRLLMKLSLMPTWSWCHWCHHQANDAEDPRDGLEVLVDVDQFPRLYNVYKGMGIVLSFQNILDNIFIPLFEVTVDPGSHPQLHVFLKQVGFIT